MSVVLTSDKKNRQEFKDRLFDKIEAALSPPVQKVEELEPVEIIEKYAQGVPSIKQTLEPMEELEPEFHKSLEAINNPEEETFKRAGFKESLSNKIETMLSPAQESEEPEPVEIIEKYAKDPDYRGELRWVQGLLDADAQTRSVHKDVLLQRINNTQTPEEVVEPELSEQEPVGLIKDNVKRVEFKDKLSRKIDTVDQKFIAEQPNLIPVLKLPHNYQDLDEKTLYGLLVRDPRLGHTSKTADLAVRTVFGQSQVPVEFTIVDISSSSPTESVVDETFAPIENDNWVPDYLVEKDRNARLEFLNKLAEKIQTPTVVDEFVEETYETGFELLHFPEDWEEIPLSVLRMDLLSLNPSVLPSLIDEALDHAFGIQLEESRPIEPSTLPDSSDDTIQSIEVPEDFTGWSSFDQKTYLTKTQKLTPDVADDIIWRLQSD